MVPNFRTITGLGRQNHGTLCRRGIFPSGALLAKPSNLNYAQAATLTCSGLTAWNALMGCEGHEVKKGDWVLVQETGGVSVAAPQVCTIRMYDTDSYEQFLSIIYASLILSKSYTIVIPVIDNTYLT